MPVCQEGVSVEVRYSHIEAMTKEGLQAQGLCAPGTFNLSMLLGMLGSCDLPWLVSSLWRVLKPLTLLYLWMFLRANFISFKLLVR